LSKGLVRWCLAVPIEPDRGHRLEKCENYVTSSYGMEGPGIESSTFDEGGPWVCPPKRTDLFLERVRCKRIDEPCFDEQRPAISKWVEPGHVPFRAIQIFPCVKKRRDFYSQIALRRELFRVDGNRSVSASRQT